MALIIGMIPLNVRPPRSFNVDEPSKVLAVWMAQGTI